jgi:hypothetical protein
MSYRYIRLGEEIRQEGPHMKLKGIVWHSVDEDLEGKVKVKHQNGLPSGYKKRMMWMDATW